MTVDLFGEQSVQVVVTAFQSAMVLLAAVLLMLLSLHLVTSAVAKPLLSRVPQRTGRLVPPDRSELLRDLGALGSPNAFAVVADDDGTALRGHSVSDWAFMKQLDAAVGIARHQFTVSLEDRANAIARACREGRVITVAWLFEAVQPALTWQEALDLERSAGGGRCLIVPLLVDERVAGAVVAGPSGEELSGTTIQQIAARIGVAAEELRRMVHATSASSPEPEDQIDLRLSALRGLGPSA